MYKSSQAKIRERERLSLRVPFAAGCAAVALYAAAVAYGSLVPLKFEPLSLAEGLKRFKEIRDLDLQVINRADWLANLFVYIPLSALGALVLGQIHPSRAWRAFAAVVAGLGSALWGVAVEFAQIWFVVRTVSLNDIRAEAIGSALGAVLGFLLVCWGGALSPFVGIAGNSLKTNLGPLYVIALTAYSLLPADFMVSRKEWIEKWQAGRIGLAADHEFSLEATSLLKLGLRIACFVPVGLVSVTLLRKSLARWYAKSTATYIAAGAVSGLIYALLVEVMQLPIFSRSSSLVPLFYGAIGGAAGGLCYVWAYHADRRPLALRKLLGWSEYGGFWWIALVVYSCLVYTIFLAPFHPFCNAEDRAARYRMFFAVPFEKLYYASEFDALTNVLQKSALFALLGAILMLALVGQKPFQRFPYVSAFLAAALALVLGLCIEMSEVVIERHIPDVTDVCIYTTGAVFGFAACWWLVTSGSFQKKGVSVL